MAKAPSATASKTSSTPQPTPVAAAEPSKGAPSVERVREGDPNISPAEQALAEALLGQGTADPQPPIAPTETDADRAAREQLEAEEAARVKAEADAAERAKNEALQVEADARARAELEAEEAENARQRAEDRAADEAEMRAMVATKDVVIPPEVETEIRARAQAKGWPANEMIEDFRFMVGTASPGVLTAMPADDRQQMAIQMREGAERMRHEGAPATATFVEQLALQIEGKAAAPPPPPIPTVSQANPALIAAAPPARRPVLRTGAEQAASNRPAPRPQLRRTFESTIDPDKARAEINLMMGFHPAKRPAMPVVPQGHWTRPRTFDQAPVRPATGDQTVRYYRVEEGRRFHGRQGGYDLPAGSIVSTLTHDLVELRNQHAKLVECEPPIRAPHDDYAGTPAPVMKNVSIETAVHPHTLEPLPREAAPGPSAPSPITTQAEIDLAAERARRAGGGS